MAPRVGGSGRGGGGGGGGGGVGVPHMRCSLYSEMQLHWCEAGGLRRHSTGEGRLGGGFFSLVLSSYNAEGQWEALLDRTAAFNAFSGRSPWGQHALTTECGMSCPPLKTSPIAGLQRSGWPNEPLRGGAHDGRRAALRAVPLLRGRPRRRGASERRRGAAARLWHGQGAARRRARPGGGAEGRDARAPRRGELRAPDRVPERSGYDRHNIALTTDGAVRSWGGGLAGRLARRDSAAALLKADTTPHRARRGWGPPAPLLSVP